MGIKGFRVWFESQFPDATVTINSDVSSETFDHVLVDMNQILHVILRRSRNEDHAVRMLMSELDRILKVATPRHSLVLAIDGAPAAAKLATQRRRRYGTLVRTEWKLQHFDKLKIPKRQRSKKLRYYNAELNSLQITPATDFQKDMESAILYWAWQRLQQRHGKLKHVRIFLSPSSVPGEGEVKILEWVLRKPRHGQSLAILGRDSDLLLEGLIIPPQWTHNVFVLQDETPRTYLSVSLWETTRALQSWLPPGAPPEQILQIRTDLVLLMILNGNDYLPKLRGSKGFSNICRIYRRILRQESDKLGGTQVVGLVDPDKLEFRLDFCIKFFKAVAASSPMELLMTDTTNATTMDARKAGRTTTPLRELNSIIDAGFVPKPKQFRVIKRMGQRRNQYINGETDTEAAGNLEHQEDDDDEDLDDDDVGIEVLVDADDDEDVDMMDDDFTVASENESPPAAEEDESEESEMVLIQLSLGEAGTEDFLQYEIWHDKSDSLKKAKHQLAALALDDFLGTDYSSTGTFDIEAGITNTGYSWEIFQPVEGKVDRYLGGLLWNLQTYQDGICADYSYNYGRRVSPLASDIVDVLKEAKLENRTVGRKELLGEEFGRPVSAGLSCLAALPSKVKHLIPEPYRWLSDDTVEKFYEESMNPIDNFFDMRLFETRCEGEIDRMLQDGEINHSEEWTNREGGEEHHGRRIITGDQWWTVIGRSSEALTHPFDPPPPPSENFAELWDSPWIRVSRVFTLDAPRPRLSWGDNPSQVGGTHHREGSHQGEEMWHVKHGDFGNFLGNAESLMDIPFKADFGSERRRQAKAKQRKLERSLGNNENKEKVTVSQEDRTKGIMDRLREFDKTMPHAYPATNRDGHTALAILGQLQDIRMIGPTKFNITFPSRSEYASKNPKRYENFELTVAKGTSKNANILKKPIRIDQDRDIYDQSKQAMKQHLADEALTTLLGSGQNWTKMSFVDMRTVLLEKAGHNTGQHQNSVPKDVQLNRDDQTALACLKQLSDVGIIGEMTYSYIEPSVDQSKKKKKNATQLEKVRLVIEPSSRKNNRVLEKRLSLSKQRPIKQESRQTSRQLLAATALSQIAGPEIDWSQMSFLSLRDTLQRRAAAEGVKQK